MQDSDVPAAMSALAPAWEALEDGMHKAPQGKAFPPSSPGSRTGKILLHAGAFLLLSCHVAVLGQKGESAVGYWWHKAHLHDVCVMCILACAWIRLWGQVNAM